MSLMTASLKKLESRLKRSLTKRSSISQFVKSEFNNPNAFVRMKELCYLCIAFLEIINYE